MDIFYDDIVLGQWVICIDDLTDVLKFGDGARELTWGREYKILTIDRRELRRRVEIINDRGILQDYYIERFVNRDIFREMQLNKILI